MTETTTSDNTQSTASVNGTGVVNQNISDGYKEKLNREIETWRNRAEENKEYMVKFQDAEKRLKEAEENSSKALTEIKEIRNSAEKRLINAELKVLAAEYGLKKNEYLKLGDLSKISVNGNDEVIGAREMLENLKNSDPDLFKLATTTNVNESFSNKNKKYDSNHRKELLNLDKKEYAKKEREFLRSARKGTL